MAILNYTTTVNAEKTVGKIQRMLAKAGANAVMSEYTDDGELSSVAFQMKFKGQLLSFRLPARIDKIYMLLQHQAREKKHRSYEHATKVAWRIIEDWIEAQLALIEAEQAEMVEVFLPYVQDSVGRTMYERLEVDAHGLLGYEPKDAPNG